MTAPGKAVTIGPVGHDIPLVPDSMTFAGDHVSMGGTLGVRFDETPERSRVLRQQLLGLAESDQPFTCEDLPELDGYFHFAAPKVDAPTGSTTDGMFVWSIEGDRLPFSARPLIQSRTQGAVRAQPDGSPNFYGIDTGDVLAWHCPGGQVFGYQPAAPNDYLRSGRGGVLLFQQDDDETFFDARPKWSVAPADYLLGGTEINLRHAVLDDTYHRVVGAQIENRPGDWAIGDSLFAVLGSRTPDKAEFTILGFDAFGHPVSGKTLRITVDGADAPYEATQVAVLRNTVECSRLRVYYWPADADYGVGSIDFLMRRGARHVECALRLPTDGTPQKFGVQLATPDAGTDHTSGIHASTSDDDDNTWTFASPQEVDTDNVAGGISLADPAFAFDFMAGLAPDDDTPDDFTSLTWQYHARVTERQRIVAA